MIGDEEREQVREATDFVSLVSETVQLRERGSGDFWGCCPFHHEKTPSFHVRTDTGFWYCFGCGEGGDVFNFVQKRENLSFPESIRYLADRAGIELHETGPRADGPRRGRLHQCLQAAEEFYQTMLLRGKGQGPDAARTYFSGRGFNSSVCKRWGLGYAPGSGMLVSHLSRLGFDRREMLAADLAVDRGGRLYDRFYDRVMFPIHDEVGRTIGMGGRVMGDAKPKYLNSKDSPVWHKSKHLFAYDKAKESAVAAGEVIVVEGYTDTIALHEAGFTNVVAVLGTALTSDHIKLLSRLRPKRIIVMLDGDEAGQRAADKTVRFIDKTDADILSVVLPDNADPAEYLASDGPDALRARLDEAVPLIDRVLGRRLDGAQSMGPGQRVKVMDEVAAVLAPLKGSILIDGYARRVADALGASRDDVLARIRNAPVPAEEGTAQRPAPSGPAPVPAPLASQTDPEPYLTADDRMARKMERELLGLMVSHPGTFTDAAPRIASLSWSDPRHESMAWAVLGLAPGTGSAEAVRAVTGVVPEAPRLLAGTELDRVSDAPEERKVAFLMDNVELFGARRRIRQIQSRLAAATGQEARDLMNQAVSLGARTAELQRSLASRG